MKSNFLAVAGASKVQLNGLPGTAPMERDILRSEQSGKNSLPRVCITLVGLIGEYKQAKKCFGKNELEKSAVMLKSIFAKIPLLVVEKNEEDKLIRELLGGCREYMTGIRLEMERRRTKEAGDTTRSLELNCYFTKCGLDQAHLALVVLKTAMLASFKAKNYITAESFARRLLDMEKLPEKLKKQATKVVQKSQQEGRNALKLNFNADSKFDLCGSTQTPIAQGKDLVRCPYCGTAYLPEFTGSLCKTCNIASVGVETVGLTCMMTR